jgi:hypothetical protein
MITLLVVQVAVCTLRPGWPAVLVVTVLGVAGLLALAPRHRVRSDVSGADALA